MRQWNRQIFRFFLVLALGAGIGGLAGQAARPEKPKMRAELPAPVIMATVMEITAPDHCLYPRAKRTIPPRPPARSRRKPMTSATMTSAPKRKSSPAVEPVHFSGNSIRIRTPCGPTLWL